MNTQVTAFELLMQGYTSEQTKDIMKMNSPVEVKTVRDSRDDELTTYTVKRTW